MRRRTRVLGVLAVLILVLGGGAAGYELGRSSGPDVDKARAEGHAAGTSTGERMGSAKGTALGRKRGRRDGYRETFRKSYLAAYKRTVRTKTPASAPPDPGQPSSCAPGLVSGANGCVRENDAVCAAYQDFVPGQGCVPPLKPGEKEAKPQCTKNWVPVGVTGACAPE